MRNRAIGLGLLVALVLSTFATDAEAFHRRRRCRRAAASCNSCAPSGCVGGNCGVATQGGYQNAQGYTGVQGSPNMANPGAYQNAPMSGNVNAGVNTGLNAGVNNSGVNAGANVSGSGGIAPAPQNPNNPGVHPVAPR